MDIDNFHEEQLLDLDNHYVEKEEDVEDVEVEGIDVATLENKIGL